MKSGVTVIDHKEEFYKFLDGYFGGNFCKNIRIMERDKEIELVPERIDYDEEQGTWDGSIYLKINKKTKMEDVINYVIGTSKADEISIDNGVLRLWWD